MPDFPLEPGSGAARIAEHLHKNPGVELDRAEIAQQLAIAVGAVDKVLQPGVDIGLITIANDGERGRLWRAGPRLKLAAAPAAAKKTARGGKRMRLPALDAAKFPVRSDVEPPAPAISRPGESRYDEFFKPLTADGMCRTGLPLSYRAAMAKAGQYFLKHRPELAKTSTFLFRAEDDNTFGIWRVARTDSAIKTTGPVKASKAA